MKKLQKNILMCFIFLGYNTQSINTMDLQSHDQKELGEAQHEKREDRHNLTEEQKAELNKAMNSDGSLKMPVASRSIRNKAMMHALIQASSAINHYQLNEEKDNLLKTIPLDEKSTQRIEAIDKSLQSIKNPFDKNAFDHAQTIALGVAMPVADSIEYDGRKYFTDLSDDEIENKMLGERMFLLSIAGYCALCNPASAAVMISGSLLHSMYTLQQRINFREKYKQDPIKTIDDHKNQSPRLKSIKDFAISTAISYIPEIIVGAATKSE